MLARYRINQIRMGDENEIVLKKRTFRACDVVCCLLVEQRPAMRLYACEWASVSELDRKTPSKERLKNEQNQKSSQSVLTPVRSN